MELEGSTIASIAYFGANLLFLIVLMVFVYFHGTYDNIKSYLKEVWEYRCVYGGIIVYIYDTSTDIGVLVEWYILSQDGNEYSVNLHALFWASIAFIILYRLVSSCLGCLSMGLDEQALCPAIIGCCLGLFDVYIIKVIYDAINTNHSTKGSTKDNNKSRQKMIGLTEAVFESLPQVVFQSIFLVRSWHDPLLKDNSNIILVAMSLCATLFGIATKYTWLDESTVVQEAKDAHLKAQCPVINMWYVLRVLWRFSYVTVKFMILCLIWSVLGGLFLFIYLPISWISWSCTYIVAASMGCIPGFMLGFVSLVSSVASQKKVFAVLHFIEAIIVMIVITWFAYDESIQCGICTDSMYRLASYNPYIEMFIIGGWIALILDLIFYFIMLKFDRFNKNALLDGWDSFFTGIDLDY